jgi:hypothetical protein
MKSTQLKEIGNVYVFRAASAEKKIENTQTKIHSEKERRKTDSGNRLKCQEDLED